MQTSALPCDAQAEYIGTVLRRPEIRTHVLDGEGHEVPVLYIDVEAETPLRPHMQLQQFFRQDQRGLAEQLARQYAKGSRLQFRAPLFGMRVIAPNVSHIALLPPDEDVNSQAPATTEPDLFATTTTP